MCQCAKTQEQIFKILIFKFFGDFLNEQLSDRPPLVELILAPNGM